MKRLLGVDLGTSSLKAAVCDLNGHILGLGRVANRYHSDVVEFRYVNGGFRIVLDF